MQFLYFILYTGIDLNVRTKIWNLVADLILVIGLYSSEQNIQNYVKEGRLASSLTSKLSSNYEREGINRNQLSAHCQPPVCSTQMFKADHR